MDGTQITAPESLSIVAILISGISVLWAFFIKRDNSSRDYLRQKLNERDNYNQQLVKEFKESTDKFIENTSEFKITAEKAITMSQKFHDELIRMNAKND